jgi:N-acetylglutamate synthase-like GNAT family acetyltransferase
MEEQVLKVTELNPQLAMEIRNLIETVEGHLTYLGGCELFARLDSAGQVLGAACAVGFDEYCLLLYVAVHPHARGQGTGSMLVNHVLTHYARTCGRMYLCTDEERFFERFGFARVDRASLPEEVRIRADAEGVLTPEAVAMQLELPKSWVRK